MKKYIKFLSIFLLFSTVINANGLGNMRRANIGTDDITTGEHKNNTQQIEAGQTPEGVSKSAWQDIQTQIRLNKYKAYNTDSGGYKSSNPANGWHIDYGLDGTTTLSPLNIANENSDDNYHVSLRLNSVAYQNHTMDSKDRSSSPIFDKPLALSYENNRLNYRWNDNITEYWINSEQKLEQWFEIKQRPNYHSQQAQTGPLEMRMTLDTDLEVSLNNNNLRVGQMTYNKLKVWDANHEIVPAQLALDNNDLKILLEDENATYPLTIDPSFSQEAYIKASNTGESDQFGSVVSISGDTMVVGAELEDSNSTGVNGDAGNNFGINSGAVYVFVRTGATWVQQAYLKASNTDSSDRFGLSVSISGDTVVVGAHLEDSNATGVDGDQSNDSLSNNTGAAYVFVRTGTSWTQQAYLKASNTDGGDYFGYSVSISGNTVLVGAFLEDSNATGVDGDQSNDSISNSGSAYVFVRTGTSWAQQAYLKASNTNFAYQFGFSVSISGDTLVVASPYEDSNATGVNGNQNNTSENISGAAYVFVRTGTSWDQQAYIKASNTQGGDQFGRSVSISGDTVVVSTNLEDSNATGIDGDQSDNSAENSGAAYVFFRNGTSWAQQAYLKASNTDTGDEFGQSVSISGDTIVVGAPVESSDATGFNGDESDNSTSASGAAYVFVRTGTIWAQQAYFKASNTNAVDLFGYSVSISSDTIVVGAFNEGSNATGVDGDQSNNLSIGSGAAYVSNIIGDVIFIDGFESSDLLLILTHLNEMQSTTLSLDYPIYDSASDTIEFYGELFYLNGNYQSQEKLKTFEYWLKEVLLYKAPFYDYDNDGIENYLDIQPFRG